MNAQHILKLSLRAILIFLVLLAGAVVFYNRALRSPKAIELPEQAAGLALTRSLSGQEAALQVNSMYSEDFTLTRAQVGYYGENEAVVIRAGGTPFAGATGEMMAIITANLSAGSGDLQSAGEQRDRGRTIYKLEEGGGLVHFYFQSARTLVWLSGPSVQAETALAEVLEFYP